MCHSILMTALRYCARQRTARAQTAAGARVGMATEAVPPLLSPHPVHNEVISCEPWTRCMRPSCALDATGLQEVCICSWVHRLEHCFVLRHNGVL